VIFKRLIVLKDSSVHQLIIELTAWSWRTHQGLLEYAYFLAKWWTIMELPDKQPNTLNDTLAQTKAHLINGNTWMRAVYMVIFSAILFVAWYVMLFIILFQFGSNLIIGLSNHYALSFSRTLTRYIYQILRFLTYQTGNKPFPFSAFPRDDEIERDDNARRESDDVHG